MRRRNVRAATLTEVRDLAPHEITCRCEAGGEFDWQAHGEKCPRRQIGAMIEAMMPKSDGPLGDGPSFAHDVKPLEEELALAKAHPEYQIDAEAVQAALEEAMADAAKENQP